MEKLHAVITGIGGYLPKEILTNEQLTQMVDTSDEWIMERVGIKTRHILEDGKGSAFMAEEAVKQLLAKTNTDVSEIDLLVCCTITPSYSFPANAVVVCGNLGMDNAFAFDLSASCSGFLFGLETVSSLVCSGKYKKVILVAAEKLSSVTNYEDRNTCPLFGDGSAAVMVEPTTDKFGILDSELHVDGTGHKNLYQPDGGSKHPTTQETLDRKGHYLHQDGRVVFKRAVSEMPAATESVLAKNDMTVDDIDWFIPHQASGRIIDAVGKRLGVPVEKVMSNVEGVGNTSAASIPICMWQKEDQFRKGQNVFLASFGAGFTWGSVYLKWGYDGDKVKK